jgi:RimJ/RimL family protein N-acetyltransferase
MPDTALIFRPMDADGARTLIGWRYPPPYQIYQLELNPAQIIEAIAFLIDPINAYYRMEQADGSIEAFCCFGLDAQVDGGDYSNDALDLGMGVRPDLTGQGRGVIYATALVQYALATYAPQRLRVTIADFNQRAQRVWQKAGFRQSQEFRSVNNGRGFVILTREGG